jgi:imidazolonepropionase-like amidohydrolase
MLIRNVRIYPMVGDIIEDGFIHIENEKISDIGSMDKMPIFEDKNVIDGRDMIALPGFVDAHCHIGMWEDAMGIEGSDGNEETDPITPQLRAIDAINPRDKCFREALEAGVTTVIVTPGSANPIGGQILAMKTNGYRIDSMVISEPIGIKFALGENPKSVYHEKSQIPSTRMAVAAVIRDQLHKAKKYMKDVDYAEASEDYEEPDHDGKCEALMPLLQKKVKAHFHAHRSDDIFTAIRIANEFNLDYVIVHGTEGHTIAKDLKEENCSVITGPFLCDRSKPELKELTPENPAILNNYGVEIAICTDHPVIPIQYLSLAAAFAVKEGMSRMDALKAITINAAKISGIQDRVGSLEIGKDADIVLFEGDPLSLEAKPKMVISNGEIIKY